MSAELEARLQRVEDLLEIHQLFVDYGRYLDAGDFAGYASLFADEGETLLGPMGRAKGPAEIEAFMTRMLAADVGKTFHLITSPTVDLHGDEATSDVMWTVLERADDGTPRVSMLGRHRDRLVRERGRWRFLRREGLLHLPATLDRGPRA